MVSIERLIEEGEKLKKTFTEEKLGMTNTSDYEGVSKWLTKCMRAVESEETTGSDSKLYKIFEGYIGNVANLRDKKFEELVGILKGIEETTPEEEESVFF